MIRLLLLCCLFTAILSGQTEPFSADYRMADGVYLSHDALLSGIPDLPWSAIAGEMVQLPEDFRVQIAGYGYNDIQISADILPYAIGLDGEVYFFTRKDEQRDFHEFTGLRIQGALSTMYYDTIVHTRQLMKAYNPINGRPFRQAYVERDKTLLLKKVLHLRSGARYPLNRESLILLCAEDDELTKALRTAPEMNDEILLRAVKLYDDRYQLNLPIRD